jgi:hypothetical protein
MHNSQISNNGAETHLSATIPRVATFFALYADPLGPAAPGMLVRDTKNRDGFVLNVPAEDGGRSSRTCPPRPCPTRVSPSIEIINGLEAAQARHADDHSR